ncbi:MAG: radical SAM protein [Truepera sp.]|nr:radical SAM protein [Truepera sp.]
MSLQHGDWLLGAQAAATVISPNRQEVYSFDLQGRPLSWFLRGTVYKRSLASRVFGRRREDGVRQRWELSEEAAAAQFVAVLKSVGPLMAEPLPQVLRNHSRCARIRDRLARILSWTPQRLLAERARFEEAYLPISILPPDQYQAVVLQATFGCSWNRCTFCSFYQDRPFSAKTPAAFTEHIERVAALLGEAVALRQSIFLADGNALMLANSRLMPLIERAQAAFPGRGIYGFVDVFSGEKKPLADWQALERAGLRRVYIGLETGHDALLAWLNKPGSAAEAQEFIATLKRAGLSVSAIVMVGAGGSAFAEAHLRDSLALLAAIPFTKGDLVYLSPFIEHPGSVYAQRAAELGSRALSDDERATQYEALKRGIRQAHPKVKVALYHLEEFFY